MLHPGRIRADITEALALLTRLPVPFPAEPAGARAAWAYPLVGIPAGFLGAIVGLGTLHIGLPPIAAAILAVGSQIFLTGALHEDGLADWADAFGARGDAATRLAIMRDSQIGTYGTIALGLSLGLRITLVAALLKTGPVMPLILAAIISRAVMPGIMAALAPARSDGLSHLTGRPSAFVALFAGAIALAPALFVMGAPGLIICVAASAGAAWPAIWAARRIGGQTGDILGAGQQCAEIAALLALTAILT